MLMMDSKGFQMVDIVNNEGEPRVPMRVYVMMIMALFAFAVAPIMVRFAQREAMPSLLIAGGRLVLSALILTPLVWHRYRQDLFQLRRRDLGLMLAAGFFLAMHFGLWVTSLEYTSVLISVVFVTSSPLWVALLEFFILRDPLRRLVIVGLIIAIGGGLLIGLGGIEASQTDVSIDLKRDVIGGGLSLAGAISVAIYLIIGRKLQQAYVDEAGRIVKLPLIPYLWLVYGSAGVFLMVIVIVLQIPIVGYSPMGYLWVLSMALIPQLIGHSALNYAVGYLSPTIVSMTTQLEPIGSAIIAYFLFGELPLPLQIVGSLVIVTGVMIANYGHGRKVKRSGDT